MADGCITNSCMYRCKQCSHNIIRRVFTIIMSFGYYVFTEIMRVLPMYLCFLSFLTKCFSFCYRIFGGEIKPTL